MSKPIIVTARQIATELKSAENDCDAALARNARLVATRAEARVAAGLPARTGRKALGRAVEAVALSAKARDCLVDAHAELAILNLRELATGDLSECPDLMAPAGLRVVGDADERAA